MMALNHGSDLFVVRSQQDTFAEFNALHRPFLVPEITEYIRTTLSKEKKHAVVVFPDLTQPREIFDDFFKYLELSEGILVLAAETFESDETNTVSDRMRSKADSTVDAYEEEIKVSFTYTYARRREVNDSIYNALRARKGDGKK
jgi:aspartate/methionine/tyrosine aminotransferase